MTPELPTFSRGGMGGSLPCRLVVEDGHGNPSECAATLSDLLALIAALPDEQRASILDSICAPKRDWVQGEEDGHYACSRCGTNLDDRDEEDGEHTREECDIEVSGWEGYSSHFLFEENKRLCGAVEAAELARDAQTARAIAAESRADAAERERDALNILLRAQLGSPSAKRIVEFARTARRVECSECKGDGALLIPKLDGDKLCGACSGLGYTWKAAPAKEPDRDE